MAVHSKFSFYRGDKVEVCIQEDGYLGSYFEATVVANKGNKYVVEYENLVEEFDEFIPLKDTVMADQVRPLPPELTEPSEIPIGTRVDASDREGWWVGTISSQKNMYGFQSEFFETTWEEVDYPLGKLRVHQDGRNGKWSVSSKKRKTLA